MLTSKLLMMSFPFFGFILSSGIWHGFSGCWMWRKEAPPKRFLWFWCWDSQTFKGTGVWCWESQAFKETGAKKIEHSNSSFPTPVSHVFLIIAGTIPVCHFGLVLIFVGEGMIEGINGELHSPAQAVWIFNFSLKCLIIPAKNPSQWELTGRVLDWDSPWQVLSTTFSSNSWLILHESLYLHVPYFSLLV